MARCLRARPKDLSVPSERPPRVWHCASRAHPPLNDGQTAQHFQHKVIARRQEQQRLAVPRIEGHECVRPRIRPDEDRSCLVRHGGGEGKGAVGDGERVAARQHEPVGKKTGVPLQVRGRQVRPQQLGRNPHPEIMDRDGVKAIECGQRLRQRVARHEEHGTLVLRPQTLQPLPVPVHGRDEFEALVRELRFDVAPAHVQADQDVAAAAQFTPRSFEVFPEGGHGLDHAAQEVAMARKVPGVNKVGSFEVHARGRDRGSDSASSGSRKRTSCRPASRNARARLTARLAVTIGL